MQNRDAPGGKGMARAPSSPILQWIRGVAEDQRTGNASDEELLRQFHAARDESCFQALLRRHGPMVLDVCRSVLPNEADAEDAFQATFLVLARKARSVRKAAALGCWLHGVAFRTALRARAEFARRRKHEVRAARREAAAPDDLSWGDVRRVVHEELNRLAGHYRAPLVLCYLQGATQDEAARLLGLPKGTLKGRLERGRALLRARLVRRGLGPAALLTAAAWPAAAAGLPPASVSATVRAAALLAAGKAVTGAVSAPVAGLTEGVLRTMFFAKLKLTAVALALVCVASFAFAVLAAAQTGGSSRGEAPDNSVPPPGQAAKGKVRAGPLTPEALAVHLGITHKSFELSFDEPPADVTLSIDVYENGKRTVRGEEISSLKNMKKHACTVLFSRRQGNGKLEITLVTPAGTYNEVMEDPFSGPGQVYPGPALDAQGRMVLAMRSRKGDGGVRNVSDLTLDKAEKALVLQVTTK